MTKVFHQARPATPALVRGVWLLSLTLSTPAWAEQDSCLEDGLPESSGWMQPQLVQTTALSADIPLREHMLSRLMRIVINNTVVADATAVLQRPCGGLLVAERDWNRWRLRSDSDQAIRLGETWFLGLDTLTDVQYVIDPLTETLRIQVPAERFATTIINWAPFRPVTPSPATPGAFVNADIGVSQATNSALSIWSLRSTQGVFGSWGVLINDSVSLRRQSGTESLRLRTAWAQDFPARMWRVEFGDVLAQRSVAGGGYFVGGIRFARNFLTQPYYQTRPGRHLQFLLNQQQAILVTPTPWGEEPENALTGQALNLPAGPIEFVELPYTSNSDIHVLALGADGSSQLVRQRSFLGSTLLRKSVLDFEAVMGALRSGGITDSYRDGVAHGSVRYGIAHGLTLGGQLTLFNQLHLYGISSDFSVPYAGTAGIDIAHSDPQQGGRDAQLVRVRVLNNFQHWGWSFRQSWFGEGFVTHPDASAQNIQRHTALQTSFRATAPWGVQNIHASWFLQRTRNMPPRNRESVRIAFPFRIHRNTYAALGYTQALRPDRTWQVTASVSIPITNSRGTRTTPRSRQGRTHSRVNLSLRAAEGDQWDGRVSGVAGLVRGANSWRASANAPLEDSLNQTAISTRWSNEEWVVRGSLRDPFGTPVVGAGAGTAVAYVAGKLLQSTQITQSFAVVDMGTAGAGKHVAGYQADDKGRVVVPNLAEYQPATLRVSNWDIPMRADPSTTSATVVPRHRSAVLVHLPLRMRQDVLMTALLENGRTVPTGAQVIAPSATTLVGHDGVIYLEDAPPGALVLRVEAPGIWCTINATVPTTASTDEIPDLGEVLCK